VQRLYVVGGQQRALRSLLTGSQDWYEYQKGLVIHVNPETREQEICVEYVSPPEACAEEDPVILFKSGVLENNKLYVCTQTEVVIYTIPQFQQIGYVSLPSFNDLHHVRPTPDGNLLIANTGLDMVMEVTLDGRVVREWGALPGDPWSRFSKEIDYRKGIRNKPHLSHPNHVFYINNDVWTTRFQQKDAICLSQPGRRLAIDIERPHDGIVDRDFVYFTTVNARIVIANQQTLKIEEIVDLTTMHDPDVLLGWCRSIAIDDKKVWVGFSRLRPTKFRENVSWVVQGFKRIMPTHIGCYDLASKKCLMEIDLEKSGMNAVFSILPIY
jgi:hypothetical protein